MSLILRAIAFLPQETLAKLIRSPKRCTICNLRYGVLGLTGVLLPCGHIFGECKCCTAKAGPPTVHSQKTVKVSAQKCLSSELECPYCGVSAVGETRPGFKDLDAVAALHAAERVMRYETKLELQRRLELVDGRSEDEEGGGDDDGDGDDGWVVESTDLGDLEMDFDEILEYRT